MPRRKPALEAPETQTDFCVLSLKHGRPSHLAPADHDLTVVVPAFNEELRLPATLTQLKSSLDDWGINYRVLVVNDGSGDRTAELADGFGPRFSTLNLPRQRGKGAAVRAGMLQATGRIVAFTDADLPFELTALRSGYDLIARQQCEVVFGARDLHGSASVVRRRLLRTVASEVFRQIVKRLISREVTDTQCGLKIFRRTAAHEIFSRTTIDGFAFDTEVVFLTRRLRIPFRRIPVVLINEYSSTLSLARQALPMLLDVLRVRRRVLKDAYFLNQKTDCQAAAVEVVNEQRKAA
ncbi:MAG TPA: glycosyltransferase [Planctomycetaceae bacterium]|nr:glycosyltransferase [Planctomycetaceae bacterium]